MKQSAIKKIVLMLVALIPVVGIHAQGVKYMNVYLISEGSFQSINLDEIDKITFPSEDEVNITMTGAVIPMAIDNIEVITFGDTDITSIEESEVKTAEIEIAYIKGSGEIKITSPEAINLVQLYNMQGLLILSQAPNTEITTLDISAYPNGIYIVAAQSNGKIETKKIIK